MNFYFNLAVTVAKTNRLDRWLQTCSSDTLLRAHDKESETRKEFRQADLKNFEIRLREMRKTAQKQNDKLDKHSLGAGLIETNPDELIPKNSEDKSINQCFKRYKKESKSVGLSLPGIRQYKTSLLLTLKHFLSMCSAPVLNNSDFEVSDSISKSDLNKKVAKAILVYHQFKGEIRANISYG